MCTKGGWTKYAGNPVLGNKSLGLVDVNVIRVDGCSGCIFLAPEEVVGGMPQFDGTLG